MKLTITFVLSLAALLLSLCVQAADVYDMTGKRVFHIEDGRLLESHSPTSRPRENPPRYTEQILIHDDSGQSFNFTTTPREVISNGTVFMVYHFNQRHFEWAEAGNLPPSSKKDTHVHDWTDRFYAPSGHTVGRGFSWTTPEQDEIPILTLEYLTYKNGVFKNKSGETIQPIEDEPNFVLPGVESGENLFALYQNRFALYKNEFGDPVYFRAGSWGADSGRSFGDWCDAVLVHFFYEDAYKDSNIESIKARRIVAAAEELETNSLAVEILRRGKSKTEDTNVFGQHYQVIYFTMIDNEVVLLNEEQIVRVKNKWLVLNDGKGPEGAFYLKKKAAKKAGLEGLKGTSYVLEIRAKPEHRAEFEAAILAPEPAVEAL